MFVIAELEEALAQSPTEQQLSELIPQTLLNCIRQDSDLNAVDTVLKPEPL